jgi:hypothetical protein
MREMQGNESEWRRETATKKKISTFASVLQNAPPDILQAADCCMTSS